MNACVRGFGDEDEADERNERRRSGFRCTTGGKSGRMDENEREEEEEELEREREDEAEESEADPWAKFSTGRDPEE